MGVASPVTSTITVSTPTVTRAGFGVLALIGHHAHFADAFRSYLTLAAMEGDGFTSAEALHEMAAAYFGQSPAPRQGIIVAKGVSAYVWSYALAIPTTTETIGLTVRYLGVDYVVSVTGTGVPATDGAALVTAINTAMSLTLASGTTTVTIAGASGNYLRLSNLLPGPGSSVALPVLNNSA